MFYCTPERPCGQRPSHAEIEDLEALPTLFKGAAYGGYQVNTKSDYDAMLAYLNDNCFASLEEIRDGLSSNNVPEADTVTEVLCLQSIFTDLKVRGVASVWHKSGGKELGVKASLREILDILPEIFGDGSKV